MGMLGGLLQTGMGLWGMSQGNKMMNNVANNMPGQEDLEKPYEKTQGILNKLTDFNAYSGPAADMATQEGNSAVQTAAMMGPMGGSSANAIRNRMKKSGINSAYQNFTKGLGNAARMQYGINRDVSSQMHQNAGDSRNIKLGQAGAMMGMGSNFMGGAEGMAGMGAAAGSLGQTAFDWGKKGLGGLLGLGG